MPSGDMWINCNHLIERYELTQIRTVGRATIINDLKKFSFNFLMTGFCIPKAGPKSGGADSWSFISGTINIVVLEFFIPAN